MTVNEFKAWLEGFTEASGDAPPTKEQWDRIKEKIARLQQETIQLPYLLPSDPSTPAWPRWDGEITLDCRDKFYSTC